MNVFRYLRLMISQHLLTHSVRGTHIYVGKLTIIGSDNGLSPGRRQAIKYCPFLLGLNVLRWRFGILRQSAITWDDVDSVLCHLLATPSHNELIDSRLEKSYSTYFLVPWENTAHD